MRVHRPRWSPYRYTRWRWHVLFAVIDALGWTFFAAFHVLRTARRWRHRNAAEQPVRSILLVQLDHLGDAILSLGLLRSIRERYPQARLHVAASRRNEELFSTCGLVDEVHLVPVTRFCRRGWRWIVEIVRWGWHLRRHRFDLAIDVRGDFPHAVLMWLAGARRRIGWSCGGGGFLLTDRAAYVPGRHEVLSRAAVAERLGIDITVPPKPRLEISEAALDWADAQLATLWPGHARANRAPLVALHIGAGTDAKRWPAEHWQQLAELLMLEPTASVVLVGTHDDTDVARQIEDTALGPRRSCLNLVGRLSLSQLAAVLRRADLFIGADSGPAHLAAAVGTPVIALFSGTNDPQQWRPWGTAVTVLRQAPHCSPCHREVCLWSDHPCMRGIAPEAVFHQAAEALGSAPSRVRIAHQSCIKAPKGIDAIEKAPIGRRQGGRRFASKTWWTMPTLRWVLATWMASVAAIYLWNMLAYR